MFIKLAVYLHISLVIILTIRVLWRRDLMPPARMAWFVIMLIFPYAGVIIYWLFGEYGLDHYERLNNQKEFKKLKQEFQQALGNSDNLNNELTHYYKPIFKYASSVNQFYATKNNVAQLMADSNTTRESMIRDFDTATQSIHILYYIWLPDNTGTAIAESIISAAKRGVKCRVIVDALGSRLLIKSPLWQAMRQAGVQLEVALNFNNIIKTFLFSRFDLRNHRKITVIDGKITYCGSQNCADPEFEIKAKYAPWVDIMFRFEGEVVAQNQLLFASDWLTLRPQGNLDIARCPEPEKKGNIIAQVFADGPTERRESTAQLLTSMISLTQEEITISTPYFVPDYSVLNTLCAAAHRGVKVTMIFPKKNDSFVVSASSRSYYRQLLEAGVRIFEYKKGLLHAKTITIDKKISLIGSTNLDRRSFDLNYENNILLADIELTTAIIQRQQSYIQESDEVYIEDVLQWSLPKQIWYNVVATVGPIL